MADTGGRAGIGLADLVTAFDASSSFAHVTDLTSGTMQIVGDVDAVVGWPLDEWATMDRSRPMHPDDRASFVLDVDALAVGDVLERSGRVRRRNGSWSWIHDRSQVTMTDGRRQLHGITTSITDRLVELGRVIDEATTDVLTGLANRRALQDELDRRTTDTGHHLVLIDLNRFKDVNDTLGHEAGDDMLRLVADRLGEVMDGSGLVARLGGDEFAIVTRPALGTDVVVARVAALADRLATPMRIGGVSISTSIAAGIVEGAPGRSDRTTMLRHADIAMYEAKRQHRTSLVFDRSMGARLERRSLLSTQLPRALEDDEIVLHFQPIVRSDTGEIAAIEGLARWEHPDFGTLRPPSFLDLVLVSERIGDFTRATVQAAITAAVALRRRGFDVPVAVNVASRPLDDGRFHSWFVDRCAEHDLDPDAIVIEVSERRLRPGDTSAAAIERLATTGARISIDDFGTGHAAFDRLRWRGATQIKLDASITRDIVEDSRNEAIVRHVVQLAHELGHSVVGEGVERHDQLDVLRTIGCEFLQGYLFSRAQPFEEMCSLLVDDRALPGVAPDRGRFAG